MNTLQLMNFGARKLKENKIVSSRLDSEILLSKTLKKKREEILLNLDQTICDKSLSFFKGLINRRCKNEPIAYIIGQKEFWSKKFFVNKDTLIPRPETELMIEKLIQMFKGKKISILDVGTGSGCILISLLSELTASRGVGIDISKKALKIAKKNLEHLGDVSKIKFLNKSIDTEFFGKFDLIVSNPPYIKRNEIKNLADDIKKYEPRIALDGGNDGLDLIKKFIYKAESILKFNGTLALEIGNGQFKKVSEILKKKKFKVEHVIKDYKDNIRCIISTHMSK